MKEGAGQVDLGKTLNGCTSKSWSGFNSSSDLTRMPRFCMPSPSPVGQLSRDDQPGYLGGQICLDGVRDRQENELYI
jgi:hypothetical protein